MVKPYWIPVVLLLAAQASANENDEVKAIAERYNLRREVRLDDNTRVDLLTAAYAIEVDWSNKWAEGIGQALFYALKTGKQPVVLLLFKTGDNGTTKDVQRCLLVCRRYGIHLMVAKEGDSFVLVVYQPKPRKQPKVTSPQDAQNGPLKPPTPYKGN